MKAKEIREKYLRFFSAKGGSASGGEGHKIIPSASLIPENDPSVLFTTAGMHPLVPYLLGEKHPMGKRLCNSQKCIRTGDIEDVGNSTHLTFFEMLGNWSLGDYFKKEAIEWSFEFLTKELKIPLEKLAISVFAGEEGIPKDEESAKIWQDLAVPKERIAFLGREDNWWGPAGKTGPCGPDTEMFYWTAKEKAPEVFDPGDKRWVEIWNDVFMQYNKTADGKFEELSQKNVDTGMGLERIAAVLQGKDNVYETELFEPIIKNIKVQISNAKSNPNDKISNEEKTRAIRIIADHIKASVFMLAERLVPSNTERGYVLRRLIRRAVRYGKLLGIEKEFAREIAKVVIEIYKDIYSELTENQDFIFAELEKEEENFNRTLEKGLKFLKNNIEAYDQFNEAVLAEYGAGLPFKGGFAFFMYETYGFPPELTLEELRKSPVVGGKINENKFWEHFQRRLREHQELSQTASAGQFKSGLADSSEQTTKYHTATHLLLAVLKIVLDPTVKQKGSNITSERLRFDFSFHRKMTEEEIKNVENIVNQRIKDNLPVVCEEMETEKAKKSGATGVFGHKYGDRVKVYTINDFSKEICAGPHVKNTGELGEFKIVKEESSSQGVRRIRAILQS